MTKKIISLLTVVLFIFSCSTVKISGRKQLALIPNSQLFPASFAQYDQFINENKVSTNATETQRIKTISDNLIGAVNKYYQHKGWTEDLKGYRWEVHLIDDPQLNAFCMPGGKIVYFTGLLSVTTTDAEIAAVMGHEIAHALANHGSERMTIAYGQNLGAVLTQLATRKASKEDQEKWMAIYGVGSTLGAVLPYSRTHESESDKIGQIIMAVAGYNPDAAAEVWVKMGKLGGDKVPEFMSTHPSHDTRMENLKKWSPDAKKIAAQFGVKF